VTTDKNPPVLCRKCRKPIDPRSEGDVLDKFGSFIRLACTTADCGHVDWYKGVVLAPEGVVPGPASDEPGEVWIHDVILGLSFRTDASSNHDFA